MKKILIGFLALASVSSFASRETSPKELIWDSIVQYEKCINEFACDETKAALLRVVAKDNRSVSDFIYSLETEQDSLRGLAKSNIGSVIDELWTLQTKKLTSGLRGL